MKKLTYFLAYASYLKSIEMLTDEECGRLFRALLTYTAEGTLPETPGNERFILPQMIFQINRDAEKYEEICRKRSSAAKKKWEKLQTDANAGKDEEKESENNKENNKDIAMESENESDTAPAVTATAAAPPPPPTLKEIEDYSRRRGLNVNPRHFFDYYTGRNWKTSEGKDVDDWYRLIESWHKSERQPPVSESPKSKSFDTDDFFNAALRRSYGEDYKTEAVPSGTASKDNQ